MAAKRRKKVKKYFSPSQANATLPLVRAIVRDVMQLARELRDRQERLARVQTAASTSLGDAYREELQQVQPELDRDQERMRELVGELIELGVELKDYETGLVDFPCRMDNREVYLCWRFGEPEVSYWHELEAGFMGRQKLLADAIKP